MGWCWWWCCCRWCDCLGAGLGLGLGFGLGSGSRLRRTSVRRCEGAGALWGGFPLCCRGALVTSVGVREPPVAWCAAAALALALAMWMRSAGRGGLEDEVEEVDEDEDEEEVVVLGDPACAVVRGAGGCGFVGGGLCCRLGGEDGGHVIGLQVRAGWLGGPGCDLMAPRADLVGSGGGGRHGAAVFAFWAWLGLGPAMREVVWVGVRGGKQFAWAAFGVRGGLAWVSWGVCGGRVRATGRGGGAVGAWAPCGGCVRIAGCGGW